MTDEKNESDDGDSSSIPRPELDLKKRKWMQSKTGRTAKTFWYTIFGYLLLVGLTVVIVLYNVGYAGGLTAGDVAFILLLLIVFSVIPYPAIVLDSRYLRSIDAPWQPRWRRYVAAGVLLPFFVGLVSFAFSSGAEAVGLAMLAFLSVSVLLCVFYLLNRTGVVRS